MQSVEINPTIQAFEVLSDRISNLEDTVNLVAKTTQLQEATTYGLLNHEMLGLPCVVTRHKSTERVDSRLNGAPAKVSAMIFSFTDLTYETVMHVAFGPDGVDAGGHFTAEENDRISAVQKRIDPQDYVSMSTAGIDSCQPDTIGETMQRIVDEERQKYPNISDGAVVRPFYFTMHTFAILVVQPRNLIGAMRTEHVEIPFASLCSDAIRLCEGMTKRRSAVEVFDVCAFSAHAYVDYCRWRYGPDIRAVAYALGEQQMEDLKRLIGHVFFQTEWVTDDIDL
jgi:hypothetical protein